MPPKAADYDHTGIEYHNISDFKFVGGTTLHDVKVAYRSINPSSTAGTILIPTCFGGWVNNTLTWTSEPSDVLTKYHIVVVAMLGNGESSSPSNKPFFPEPGQLRYEDVVRSQYHLLTEGLGIKQLEAVIGFSMGGQQVYHWAVMYPDYVKRAVSICSSARTSPHNYAFLEGPIAAMINSMDYIAWKEVQKKVASGERVGANLEQIVPKQALIGFARAYGAWLTSAAWFRQRIWQTPAGGGFSSVERYLQTSGEGELGWNADDLLVLARMWQMGDIGKTAQGETTQMGCAMDEAGDKALYEALSNIKCPVLLMPGRTDQYFPPEDSEIEMHHLKRGRLEVIESIWGHAAGGSMNPDDVKFMGEKIQDFIATTA